jgi:hypothetical protein
VSPTAPARCLLLPLLLTKLLTSKLPRPYNCRRERHDDPGPKPAAACPATVCPPGCHDCCQPELRRGGRGAGLRLGQRVAQSCLRTWPPATSALSRLRSWAVVQRIPARFCWHTATSSGRSLSLTVAEMAVQMAVRGARAKPLAIGPHAETRPVAGPRQHHWPIRSWGGGLFVCPTYRGGCI